MGWWWRKRNKKPTLEKQTLEKQTLERGAQLLKDLIEFGHGISNPIKFFSADEILKATNNFSDSNLVSGLDYYYKLYSGKNENHPMILIKKCVRFYRWCQDIAVSSMVSGHKNFLKLVGCCLESEDPVMVYHGVKKHYQLDISEQPWKRRMKIAEDIATALAYLHTAFPRPFVYRNIHPWNILLDEDGVAKLTDFSRCVSIPEGETFVKVDREVGFSWFLDDNYKSSGVVSEKTDVFAFGMFIGLRLLLGYKGILELYLRKEEESEGGGSDIDYEFDSKMKRHARNLLSNLKEDRRIEEIADPEMGKISEQEFCQMKAFLKLSRRCMMHRS